MSGGPEHPVVIAPFTSRFWSVPERVRLVEETGESPGATYPHGFAASGVVAGLKQSGRPDMGVLTISPERRRQAASGAVFTRNAFAAAPVVLDRTECDLSHLVAVVMNSANANACTGLAGLAAARAMQKACADTLGVERRRVAVGSTGVIGVLPDAELMTTGAEKAAQAVRPDGAATFCQAILTTDRFPKMCALEVETVDGPVRLGACAKGAGMIAPAMATMLCVATTDAVVPPQTMQALLVAAVGRSFNRITVDGEMSTNDSVFFLSSGASDVHLSSAGLRQMDEALTAMLRRIALMMVADGEGASKVMRLQVEGAESEAQAIRVGRAIAESPLVKTAMNGEDPNWGRVISSAGAAMAGRSLPRAALWLCGVQVVENAEAAPLSAEAQASLKAGMKEPEVEIRLDLGLGRATTELFFADLGHQYVTINAEYHS